MNELLSAKAKKQWETGNLKACDDDCQCGKHKPNKHASKKCKPECMCGKHFRTKEWNDRIRQARLRFEEMKRAGRPVQRKDAKRVEKACPVIELNAVQVVRRLYEPRKVTQK